MNSATFNTIVNGLPYRVIARKFSDGRKIITVQVKRKGGWAMLNEHTHRYACSEAKGNVVLQINEFFEEAC